MVPSRCALVAEEAVELSDGGEDGGRSLGWNPEGERGMVGLEGEDAPPSAETGLPGRPRPVASSTERPSKWNGAAKASQGSFS